METVLLVNKQDSYLPVLEAFTKVFRAYFIRNQAKIKVRNIDFTKNIGFGQIHKENSFAGKEISIPSCHADNLIELIKEGIVPIRVLWRTCFSGYHQLSIGTSFFKTIPLKNIIYIPPSGMDIPFIHCSK